MFDQRMSAVWNMIVVAVLLGVAVLIFFEYVLKPL